MSGTTKKTMEKKKMLDIQTQTYHSTHARIFLASRLEASASTLASVFAVNSTSFKHWFLVILFHPYTYSHMYIWRSVRVLLGICLFFS